MTSKFYPIIYVRGYAMTDDEMEETVATPYMGFNLGSTKLRQSWDRKIHRHIFESPLVRLMKDYGYKDVYYEGKELEGIPPELFPDRPIFIFRYYEKEWSEVSEDETVSNRPHILQATKELSYLIMEIRKKICGDDNKKKRAFKINLIAHSMGGLICRCLIQNHSIGHKEARNSINKVFTYATPHNGIDMAGMNVPSFFHINNISNFNRAKIKQYLDIQTGEANSLDGKFDENRFFCLVGTNSKDYLVAKGVSSVLAGELSDGLVRIQNAYVKGAPRAHVHRSHSGHYGIVNSEEGYQNLIRFLFGDYQMKAIMKVNKLPLPPRIQLEKNNGKSVRASYYFNVSVTPRGGTTYYLDQRLYSQESAIFRQYNELFKTEEPRHPVLFSIFLDCLKRPKNFSNEYLVVAADLEVSATEYEVDGFLFLDTRIPGERLFKDLLILYIFYSENIEEIDLHYNWGDMGWSENKLLKAERIEIDQWMIKVKSPKEFEADIIISISPYH